MVKYYWGVWEWWLGDDNATYYPKYGPITEDTSSVYKEAGEFSLQECEILSWMFDELITDIRADTAPYRAHEIRLVNNLEQSW